jgi:2,3-bisphosphoglycerate-dependent phosphoglycerate mutase
MTKQIYLVRHCKAEGQLPEAKLTKEGIEQAKNLAKFFEEIKIGKENLARPSLIVSSPFLRARQTIEPLAQKLELKIEIDERLAERVLSTEMYSDWEERLKNTFWDLDLVFEGGESSKEAMNRGIQAINDILTSELEASIVVSHGNLLSLILKYYDDNVGFEDWKALTNPDVYLLSVNKDNTCNVKRVWRG